MNSKVTIQMSEDSAIVATVPLDSKRAPLIELSGSYSDSTCEEIVRINLPVSNWLSPSIHHKSYSVFLGIVNGEPKLSVVLVRN